MSKKMQIEVSEDVKDVLDHNTLSKLKRALVVVNNAPITEVLEKLNADQPKPDHFTSHDRENYIFFRRFKRYLTFFSLDNGCKIIILWVVKIATQEYQRVANEFKKHRLYRFSKDDLNYRDFKYIEGIEEKSSVLMLLPGYFVLEIIY